MNKMKVGDVVEISACNWRGSKQRDGRKEGIVIRIEPSTVGDPLIQIEMSFEAFGRFVTGISGSGTIEQI
jgi:hypothetical protein